MPPPARRWRSGWPAALGEPRSATRRARPGAGLGQLLVMGLLAAWTWSPGSVTCAGPAATQTSGPAMAGRSYQEQLAAFDQIRMGFTQDQVLGRLGPPDRRQAPDSGEDWYDSRWIYDFQTLPGFPREHPRTAVQTGELWLLDGQVRHVRQIGWLE